MKQNLACYICVFLALFYAQPAFAEKRIALVIGNSAYKHTPELINPRNDAEAVIAVLGRLGFEILGGVDLTRSKFEKSVKEFSSKLRTAQIGLFFYAGHGLQVNGRNYLVPIDAVLKDEADLDFSMIELDKVLVQMERSTKTNLVFIDACRDNPLARNLARAMGLSRSTAIGRGMARTTAGIGSLITYATQPDNVALDGKGKNSPFTKALLSHIETPGLDIAHMLRRVRREVIKETNGHQVPWSHSSLTDGFIFKLTPQSVSTRSKSSTVAAPPAVPKNEVLAAYQETRKLRSCDAYTAFERSYSKSFFSRLARQWIDQNCRLGTAMQDRNRQQTEQFDPNFPFDGIWQGEQCVSKFRHLPAGCYPRLARINKGVVLARWGRQGRPRSGTLKGKITKNGTISLAVRGISRGKRIVGKRFSGQLRGRASDAAINLSGNYSTGRRVSLKLARQGQSIGKPVALPDVSRQLSLAKQAQTQLKRIGCYENRIDGDWGKGSKRAVAKFNRYANLKLSKGPPDIEIINVLKKINNRICPHVQKNNSNTKKAKTATTRVQSSKRKRNCRLETVQECISRVCPAGGCGLRGSGICNPKNRHKICR